MINLIVPTLPDNSMLMALDAAHQQGLRQYLSAIGHDSYRADHRVRASNALMELRRSLNGRSGPDYNDPYTAAAYIVSYHLSHCILACWSFRNLFRRYGVPDAIYVCDVGAGTGAGMVGLALALSEHPNHPPVYFDAVEPSQAMVEAGAQFWTALSSIHRGMPKIKLRDSASMPSRLLNLREGALHVVTAFHLSLPYDDNSVQGYIRRRSTEGPAQKALRDAIRKVSPDIGIFTCHEGKEISLRRAIDDTAAWVDRSSEHIEIPSNDAGVRRSSSFYTNCAADLGFDVSEGTSVKSWSRYRFSPPKGVLLLRVSTSSERERAEVARVKGEQERRREIQRIAAQRAEEERQRKVALEKLWSTLSSCRDSGDTISAEVVGSNSGGLLVKWEGLSGFVPFSHCRDIADRDGDLEKLQG